MHRQSGNTFKRAIPKPRKSENRANLSDPKEMNSIQSPRFVCGFERGARIKLFISIEISKFISRSETNFPIISEILYLICIVTGTWVRYRNAIKVLRCAPDVIRFICSLFEIAAPDLGKNLIQLPTVSLIKHQRSCHCKCTSDHNTWNNIPIPRC